MATLRDLRHKGFNSVAMETAESRRQGLSVAKPEVDPLHTPLCDMLGVELPIIAFTHCREVAVAAINAGGFAVLGEAMKTSDEIVENINFIRERVAGKPFGIDLVLPSSVPPNSSALA